MGGGDLSVNRTYNLEIDGITNADISDMAPTDSLLVNDGGVMRQCDFQDFGITSEVRSGTITFNADEQCQLHVLTGSTTRVWGQGVAVHERGTIKLLVAADAGAITLDPASNVRFNSIVGGDDSTVNRTVTSGGTCLMININGIQHWNVSRDIT